MVVRRTAGTRRRVGARRPAVARRARGTLSRPNFSFLATRDYVEGAPILYTPTVSTSVATATPATAGVTPDTAGTVTLGSVFKKEVKVDSRNPKYPLCKTDFEDCCGIDILSDFDDKTEDDVRKSIDLYCNSGTAIYLIALVDRQVEEWENLLEEYDFHKIVDSAPHPGWANNNITLYARIMNSKEKKEGIPVEISSRH